MQSEDGSNETSPMLPAKVRQEVSIVRAEEEDSHPLDREGLWTEHSISSARSLANNDNRDLGDRAQKDRADTNIEWVIMLKRRWTDPRAPQIDWHYGQDALSPKDAIIIYYDGAYGIFPLTERNFMVKLNVWLQKLAPAYVIP